MDLVIFTQAIYFLLVVLRIHRPYFLYFWKKNKNSIQSSFFLPLTEFYFRHNKKNPEMIERGFNVTYS
jgi:hypothetical protein